MTEKPAPLKMHCKYCGVTLRRLLFYALLHDLGGASISPDPMYCHDAPNHEHDLVTEAKA